MLADRVGCCEVMPGAARGVLASGFGAGTVISLLLAVMLPVGKVPARGSDTSMPAGSCAFLSAMARRSMAPTTLRPNGRAAEATPRSTFLAPTTRVRSEVLENVVCQ